MSKSIKRNLTLPLVVIIFALIGIGVSIYLTYIHYMVTGGDASFSSFCNINHKVNCDAVAASSWSKVFGIPLSLWGTFYYLFITILFLLYTLKNTLLKVPLYFLWFSIGGGIYTIALIYISKVILDLWCLLCAVLWVVNLIFLIVSFFLNEQPIKNHFSIIWSDMRWYFSKTFRSIPTILFICLFVSGLFYTTHLEAKKQAALLKEKPVFNTLLSPITIHDHSYGSQSPKLTIVEFTDFQCPHCHTLHKDLKKIIKKNKNIKIVHKDFPLDQKCYPLLRRPFHQNACKAALFVRCAGKQGKYWDAFDKAFENQRKLNDDKHFEWMTNKLKLNANQLRQCMEDPETMTQLQSDIQEAMNNGFNGTPVIVFESDQQLLSGWSKGRLEKAIEYWLKGK